MFILVHKERLYTTPATHAVCAIITDAGTVTIEAMCSSYSAGFKWTVNETISDAYTVSVGFRCTSGSVSLYRCTVPFNLTVTAILYILW